MNIRGNLQTAVLALLAALLSVFAASAQTTINGSRTILGNWDASGANTTKACKAGTIANLPATCALGECYFETNATAGQNIMLCTATNTWSGISATIGDAAADGVTKGKAAFTAADFNDASGVISIDYTNAQSADASHKGFLSSTDWSTFNGKVGGLTGGSGGTTTGATVTIAGGVGIATVRSSDTITVSHQRYAATVTSTTTVTVTGATHGIASSNLRVTCYDNASPRALVEPDSVTIDDTTHDVVINFFAAQSGKCYIE